MIPKGLSTVSFTKKTMPSLQHRMNYSYRVIGKCDNLEALKQTVYKILNTERYENVIYSRNYGVELKSLLGQPVKEVLPTIESRIKEALLQDDRILSVEDFVFDTSKKHIVSVQFTVKSNIGNLKIEKEVSV